MISTESSTTWVIALSHFLAIVSSSRKACSSSDESVGKFSSATYNDLSSGAAWVLSTFNWKMEMVMVIGTMAFELLSSEEEHEEMIGTMAIEMARWPRW